MTLHSVIDLLTVAAMLAMALVAVHAAALGEWFSAVVVLLAVALVAFAWARWAEVWRP